VCYAVFDNPIFMSEKSLFNPDDPAHMAVIKAFGMDTTPSTPEKVPAPEASETKKTPEGAEEKPELTPETKPEGENTHATKEALQKAEALAESHRETSGYEEPKKDDKTLMYGMAPTKRKPVRGALGFFGVMLGLGLVKLGKKSVHAGDSFLAKLDGWGKGLIEKNWKWVNNIPILGSWLTAPVEKTLGEKEAEAAKKAGDSKEKDAAKAKKEAGDKKKKTDKEATDKRKKEIKETMDKMKAEEKTLAQQKKERDKYREQMQKAGIPDEEIDTIMEEWDKDVKEQEEAEAVAKKAVEEGEAKAKEEAEKAKTS